MAKTLPRAPLVKLTAQLDPSPVRSLEAAEDTFGPPLRAWIAGHMGVSPDDELAGSWRKKTRKK